LLIALLCGVQALTNYISEVVSFAGSNFQFDQPGFEVNLCLGWTEMYRFLTMLLCCVAITSQVWYGPVSFPKQLRCDLDAGLCNANRIVRTRMLVWPARVACEREFHTVSRPWMC
jgi:hypothetical protein